MEKLKLLLPDAPTTVKNYSSSGNTLYSTFTLTDIKYSFGGMYSNQLTITWAAHKTYDHDNVGDRVKLSWRLYEADEYTIGSGTAKSESLNAGDKVKDQTFTISCADLYTGKAYRLEILNTAG